MRTTLAVVGFTFLLFAIISIFWIIKCERKDEINNEDTTHLMDEDGNIMEPQSNEIHVEGEDTARVVSTDDSGVIGESRPPHSNTLNDASPLSVGEKLIRDGYGLLVGKGLDDPRNISVKWGDLSESGIKLLISNFDIFRTWILRAMRSNEPSQDPPEMPLDEDIELYKDENKDKEIVSDDDLIGFILAMNFYGSKEERIIHI